jgi:superfamily II DNA or RNA helicase
MPPDAFGGLLSRLDPRPDVRGRQFERICAWYLRSAPEYRRRFRKVWLWAEWPGAWGGDAGIDLVAEEHNGDIWAIQAKVYNPDYAIKKADVDSFLSEAGRPQFSYRLLIATTDRLGARARRTLDDQREPVGYLLRSQLELARVEWPASPDELRPRRAARKKPFPHVKEAIRATVKSFDRTDRGQLIMACGTGKTLAAMWISERLDAKRTLILVPSLSLLSQTLREWSANTSKPFDYLAVCSDETVAEQDEFVASTAELGLPVTTDPEVIAAFLRRRGRRVVFATYQSSPQIAAVYSGRTPQFDLAVADEAHRCAGRVSNDFATILDGERVKARRRLFMTATPRFFTQRVRKEAGQLDVEIASMDDEAAFGPVLHRLSFGEAIERDLLSDYQVVVVGVTDSMYRRWAERGEFVSIDGKRDTDARSLAGQIGLAKTMRKYDLHRIISFHGRVKKAREFSAELPKVIAWMPPQSRPGGALWSEHVSGVMTSGHRDRLLLRFRNLAPGERGLLSNARCLGEGVDVPTIDGVAFIDPRRSTIDIIQALGRAIRKAPKKKAGTIVIPVFVDEDADPEDALDDSAFKHVWDVLKALRAHDELLAEELDEIRRRLGALRVSPERPGKIKLDVPREVGVEFARAFDVRLVEQSTASWEFFFGLLERFVEREGNAEVPYEWREGGFRLGQWVIVQRTHRRTIDHQRRARLETVSGWTWDARETKWEKGFAQLLRFVEREGHAQVPKGWGEDGYPVGQWVEVQRHRRRRRKLSPERRSRLEALPGWTWDSKQAAWEEGFAHLLRFIQREGDARVPQDWREDGYRLGEWVGVQRRKRGRRVRYRERDARLEALPGWIWHTNEAAWEEGFAHLVSFVEREGHARPPRGWLEGGYRLGQWVTVQRHRQETLDREKQARLEALPGWAWSLIEETWEEGFAHLLHFVEREGHALVPQAWHEGEFPLGRWVSRQRSWRKKLDPQRQARLQSVPGWAWNKHEAAWEKGFAHLVRFVEREGHLEIRGGHRENGFALRGWFDKQRRDHRIGTLAEERARRLEALPGWTWEAQKAGARG